MICVIPPFEVNGLPSNISYTIQVGAAPGPNLTDGRLTLDVRPNPMFATDGRAIIDNEIVAGEGGLLTIRVSQCPSYHCTVSCDDHLLVYIQGTNLNSVERKEIVVTVGGVVCIERTSEEDINAVSCLVSCTSLYGLFLPYSMSVLLQTILPVDSQRNKLWYDSSHPHYQ